MGPCIFGNEDGLGGICRHLTVHYSGNTECTLILEDATARYHLLSGGCNLKNMEGKNKTYCDAVELTKDRKDVLYEHQNPGRSANHDRKMWTMHTF
jgi:hypothetical protein